jgi:hypothetical protein
LKMMMLGVRSPQSIACGVGTSVSRIELYNSDRIVSLFMFLYEYCYCYSLMSTICMKLDPGMHIGMHLVCFSKTGCDKYPTSCMLRSSGLIRCVYKMMRMREIGVPASPYIAREAGLQVGLRREY